ncbi:uncharacterized protein [Pleurodeles waltl]|uniref:uncharacterized protein n=1 Tax=Pleurodeles waltl TaxID=8319 RepID=UPI0037097DBE
MSQLAPPKILKPTSRNKLNQPWFTSELKAFQRKCRQLERQWKLNPGTEERELLKSTFKIYRAARFKAKSDFSTVKVQEALNVLRELIKVIKELSTPFKPPDLVNTQEYCDKVAKHFENKILCFYANFAPLHVSGELIPCISPDSLASEVTLSDFPCPSHVDQSKLILNMRSGSPLDLCPPSVIRMIPDYIARILMPSFQEILKSGCFPSRWKETIVVPVKKKPLGDVQDLDNLRPIVLLPFFAKILEKIMNKALVDFLGEVEVLDPSQHGFRKAHSTKMALISSSDSIRRLVDDEQGAILVLFDLSAAFDTISSQILTARLYQAGVRDRALK